jgi:hypothetical protein
MEAETRTAAGDRAPPGRGRILRLKQGYNPNSSSIGSIVFVMPAALLGITVAFGVAAGVVSAVLLRGGEDRAPDDD